MAHHSVYVTAPDHETALKIARAIVDERLAACANILGPMTSVYRWEGKVMEEGEVSFIAKTTEAQLPVLIARIKTLHPYQVPCIVAWPIAAGHQPYLDWISAETRV
ncbi:MAG TPA: divalent-cation tolerance protein CutA [Magnetospirillaceae bacterium]|jgi:periplasmic divalent cation tolerance protein